MRIQFIAVVLILLAGSSSCRKHNNGSAGTVKKYNDTALAIARDFYLWYDQIPSTFDAQEFADPAEVMVGIRQYSMEDGFTEPVDVYSFGTTKEEWNKTSSGIDSDFGIYAGFLSSGDLRIRFVHQDSPAGKAGVRRGWQIESINGNNNLSTSNSDAINEALSASTVKITFKKPDGESVDLDLTATEYQKNPIFLDTVYTEQSQKVGYLVFNSFLGDTSRIVQDFESIFAKFSEAGIGSLIVDLRYNGGGYVDLQEKLANYLIRPLANGSVMMRQKFNDKYGPILDETTMFHKNGALDVSNIYFIVDGNTASASELLINNLKPYMTVKLVGETTYGKQVGFFNLSAGDYYVFPISFKTVNSKDEGNYFNGIDVDQTIADGIDKDWGDKSEARLASVLKFINTGSYSRIGEDGALNSTLDDPSVRNANNKLNSGSFNGMIGRR